ncbi:hypothetical protein GXW78_06610 [Roseomonas terrae]|uniref:DUF1484 family protein n=1 Tax=Neoroseomonas terrae TaxID=424799 RepID=A0ABS5EE79_9PROT|nr:hypothetical protein [Neoroseomonas terrae]MBR0649326.1 hypothetical protein [Neoroseomonas terrae]
MDSIGTEARQATALLAAIEAIEAMVAVAVALVGERRRIELDGLEAEVERLCAACLAAPRSAVPAVRVRLLGLVSRLDGLRDAMPRA